jgi:hypothetical protein
MRQLLEPASQTAELGVRMKIQELQELFDKANEKWVEAGEEAGNMPFWELIISLADIAGVSAPTAVGEPVTRLNEATEVEW